MPDIEQSFFVIAAHEQGRKLRDFLVFVRIRAIGPYDVLLKEIRLAEIDEHILLGIGQGGSAQGLALEPFLRNET